MVNLENREFIMELNSTDMAYFRQDTGLPRIVEEHISVDVFLKNQLLDRYMFLDGSKNRNLYLSLTPKTMRRLKYKLYTDKPEGLQWDHEESENVEI